MYKSKLNRNVKRAVGGFVLVVVAAIVLGVVAWVTLESNISKPEGALYQYFLGVRTDYAEGSTLNINEMGDVVVQTKYGEVATDSSPVYYEEADRIITAADMVYVDAHNSAEYYIPALSEFVVDGNSVYYLGYGNEKIRITNGFLFDGVNTYVALEESTLFVQEFPIEFSVFSFATVDRQGNYSYYEYETEVARRENIGNYEVRMENIRETYDVSLTYDKGTLEDGIERLMFVAPEYLDLLVQ